MCIYTLDHGSSAPLFTLSWMNTRFLVGKSMDKYPRFGQRWCRWEAQLISGRFDPFYVAVRNSCVNSPFSRSHNSSCEDRQDNPSVSVLVWPEAIFLIICTLIFGVYFSDSNTTSGKIGAAERVEWRSKPTRKRQHRRLETYEPRELSGTIDCAIHNELKFCKAWISDESGLKGFGSYSALFSE